MTDWMNQTIPLTGVIPQVWAENLVAQAQQKDRRAGQGLERGPKGAAYEWNSGVPVEYRGKHIPQAEEKYASC